MRNAGFCRVAEQSMWIIPTSSPFAESGNKGCRNNHVQTAGRQIMANTENIPARPADCQLYGIRQRRN